MAIQMRRGSLAKYNKNKMLAGEWGISIDADTNDQKAMIAFAPGVDKEVMFVEDAAEQIAVATAGAIDTATEEAEAWAHGDKFDTREFFSGDGTTTSFALAYEPSSVSGVFVDNARTTYTRSGKTITLATAPQSSSNNVRVDYTVNVSTDNAKYYKEQAEAVAESIPEDYSKLSDDVDQLKNALMLQEETIPDTVQTITFDSAGNVSAITHTANNVAVRTDAFTFGTGTITEVRTLSTGESLTIVTNTTTLQTTVTYAAA